MQNETIPPEMLEQCSADTATGNNLNKIGALCGLVRLCGESDESFRKRIMKKYIDPMGLHNGK